MTRKTSADFDPQVLADFDAYVHGALSRRGFLAKIARYAGAVCVSLEFRRNVQSVVLARPFPRRRAENAQNHASRMS